MRISNRSAVVCLFSSLLIACLAACGGSSSSSTTTPKETKHYAVADYENNRVLIYDAPFSTNQNASVVLGQTDLTSGKTYSPASAANVLMPDGVAADSSGNLYVADFVGCRILQFKPPFTNNMNASVVIGEPDFVTRKCTATANTFEGISGVAIDGSGNLWVSDHHSASRILEFKPPFSNGMSASLVIGQANLTSSVAGCNQGLSSPTSSTICGTKGIAFDASGNLWVSDSGNDRILEFKTPFTNGMAASLVLGQASFTTDSENVTASLMDDPGMLAFDASGNLWVPDAFNQRVLRFSPPFSNGMAATLELGQPSATAFTSSTANTSQGGLNFPIGVSFDSGGNMQVVDIQNSRVVIFEPPFTNGMNATTVLGQTGFTSGDVNQGGNVGANTLDQPNGGITF